MDETQKELTPAQAELAAAKDRLAKAQDAVNLLNREKVTALQTRLQERKNREEQERFEAQRKAEEIAAMWRKEFSVTPSNMKWLFILLNILFFFDLVC